MRHFIISEAQFVMLTARAKPIDLTLEGRREWKNLIEKCRKKTVPEGTYLIKCYATNREGKSQIEDIVLPRAEFE